MKTVDYANEYLFKPLGIKMHTNYLAETAEEHKQFTIGKLPKENIWFCDTDGLGTPGYGLCRSAEDMAKIRLLCLNKGSHDKKLIEDNSTILDTGEFASHKDNCNVVLGWMPIEEIQNVTIYPEFLKTEIYHLDEPMKHFVSNG